MDGLSEFIYGIPWWVYLVFLYLVNIGMKAMKPRTVPVSQLVFMPVFLIGFSFYSLYQKLDLGFVSLIPIWFLFLIVGAYFGSQEIRGWHYKIDTKKGEITIPGNYSTLILLLVLFGFRFFWGSLYATLEDVPTWVYFADTVTGALFTGLFIGRAGWMLHRFYRKG